MNDANYLATSRGIVNRVVAVAAALLWIVPLLYAVWAAVHPSSYMTRFDLTAPLTVAHFAEAWVYAPFPRYMLNTILLVFGLLAAQFVLGTLAGFAFARFDFVGSRVAFGLVLVQLMITPEILIVENYRTMAHLGLVDSIPAIALPYAASAFGIFLLRQTFKQVPRELEDAALIDGAG
ncbi:MAG: carbohydrate ABC transporter permease, partial [Alkalispirochaeta sp.]